MSPHNRAPTLQLLHQLALPLVRALADADRVSGCSAAQLSALTGIVSFGTTSLTRLARHERISLPTLSRVVDSLVALGLVARRTDKGDRRAVTLAVTERGRAVLETADAARVAALNGLLRDLNEEDWAALARSAEALNRVFGYGPEPVQFAADPDSEADAI